MKRFLYERMITELSKESKEELIQRIMSLEEIECSDRAFVNECQAGSTIYNINELFSALDDLNSHMKKLQEYMNWLKMQRAVGIL